MKNIRAAKIVALGGRYIGTNAEMQRYIENDSITFPAFADLATSLSGDHYYNFYLNGSKRVATGRYLYREHNNFKRFVLISNGVHCKVFPEQILGKVES